MRATIEQDGFAIMPNLFSERKVADLRKSLERATLSRSRAGVRHALRHPAFAQLARDSCLVEIAREILGPDAFPFSATLFDKSPEANWLVVWHQDTALPLRERSDVPGWGPWSVKEGVVYAHAPAYALAQILALRIHLDDSTAENGPLRVLPGTHRGGVLSDDAIHELVHQHSGAECLVSLGGVLAMRPLLVHASSKLREDAPRRVLHVEYASSRFVGKGMELALDPVKLH
jgi:ectoine hydroxylase-related dioxygenase (phytanoyl-CoA dioxygenase family)